MVFNVKRGHENGLSLSEGEMGTQTLSEGWALGEDVHPQARERPEKKQSF